MGLFIIRSFMDEVDYQAGPPNVLRMVKRRASRAEGEIAPLSTRVQPRAVTATKRSSSKRSRPVAHVAHLALLDPGDAHIDRKPASSESGWRMKAVDVGAATSMRKTGSAGRK
jgi:hypothetical protein